MTANNNRPINNNNVQIPRLSLPRNRTTAPLHRLSVDLLKTYTSINQKYYHQNSNILYNDGYDDEKGEYLITLGEKLNDRYQIKSMLGKGSYGQVVEAYDHVGQENVAVKIIKNKVPFYTQGQIEVRVLERMNGLDPDDSHGIVRLKDNFLYRNHLCLVFELLSVNLFELLKRTQFRGVSLNLIRKFGHQILSGLFFQAQAGVIHCDLKPENILLKSPSSSALKIIDYGSSCFVNERIFPYIQSRFYRAPEVILEAGYSMPIDMWSVGCILVELHTGHPLFNGQDEHQLLVRIIQLLGYPPSSLLCNPKAHKFFRFQPDGTYSLRKCDLDPKDIRTLDEILGVETGGPGSRRMSEKGHSREDYLLFKDLLLKMLTYVPSARITPLQALNHPFFLQNGVQLMTASPSFFRKQDPHQDPRNLYPYSSNTTTTTTTTTTSSSTILNSQSYHSQPQLQMDHPPPQQQQQPQYHPHIQLPPPPDFENDHSSSHTSSPSFFVDHSPLSRRRDVRNNNNSNTTFSQISHERYQNRSRFGSEVAQDSTQNTNNNAHPHKNNHRKYYSPYK